MRQALENEGMRVRLIVAGQYFRLVTVLTLQQKADLDDDEVLSRVVHDVLNSPELYNEMNPKRLQQPEVDTLVSRLAQLDFVQAAAQTWRQQMAQRALDDGVQVVIFDGRNMRRKLSGWLHKTGVPVVLELIIACRADVAAKRYLAAAGNRWPNHDEIVAATEMIERRRSMDRQRSEAPYLEPQNPIRVRAGIEEAHEAVRTAFSEPSSTSPRPIVFDNSRVPLADGLATVTALALAAIRQHG